jgi:hypothetical protein
MPDEYLWRGSGMTKRKQYLIPATNDNVSAALDYHAKRSTFEGWIPEVELFAQESLRAAGRKHLGSEGIEEDTPLDYARLLLKYVAAVRRAIKSGDAGRAARWGVEIGQLVREWELKEQWQADALSGHAGRTRLVGTATKANRRRSQQRSVEWERWLKEAHLIRAKSPKLNDSAVARLIKKRLRLTGKGTAEDTIRKILGKAG